MSKRVKYLLVVLVVALVLCFIPVYLNYSAGEMHTPTKVLSYPLLKVRWFCSMMGGKLTTETAGWGKSWRECRVISQLVCKIRGGEVKKELTPLELVGPPLGSCVKK